jgi:hypothetical protein
MKSAALFTLILIAVFAILRFFTTFDPFVIKVCGIVMAVFGVFLVLALGSYLEGTGTMQFGGSLIVAGVAVILFI